MFLEEGIVINPETDLNSRLSAQQSSSGGKTLESLNLHIDMQGVSVDIDWFRLVCGKHLANETWHSHSGIEIHFLFEGSSDFCFVNSVYTLNAGEMIIIPKSQIHRLAKNNDDAFKRFILSFSIQAEEHAEGQFLNESLSVNEPKVMKIPDDVANMLQECQDESQRIIMGYVSMIELMILRILISISREISGYPIANEVNLTKRTYINQMAGKIMGFIERNVCQNITIRDISEFMHLSSKQIQRMVQKEYKCTVKELIVRLKLQMSKEYLKNTEMNISEISEMMGFSSEQSFCRFFRNAEGQSPNQYRKGSLGVR